jgi:PEGA domain
VVRIQSDQLFKGDGGDVRQIFTFALLLLLCAAAAGKEAAKSGSADDKPRVFITDSQSWEMSGRSGGAGGAFAAEAHGGARPQTAEIVKTFGERCPQVITNNLQEKADYIVVLDHEGGKGILRHKNKVAVFTRITGDSVVSKSTLSLGGSVQDACEAIKMDWPEHGGAIRTAEEAAAAAGNKPAGLQLVSADVGSARVSGAKLSISSSPDGADIEADGSFVGNTPSDIQLSEGEHEITVKKSGFKAWEKKLKVSNGSSVHVNAELEKSGN